VKLEDLSKLDVTLEADPKNSIPNTGKLTLTAFAMSRGVGLAEYGMFRRND
jgi:hypothetical protein